MLSPVDVIVGQEYDVPCVKTKEHVIVPVLLPHHIDNGKNCLIDVGDHYHIDFRFAREDILGQRNNAVLVDYSSSIFMKNMIAIKSTFTSIESAFFFVNRWYKKNAYSRLHERRCPHQGTQVVNSCGTCPAHGLKWNLKSGRLADFKLPFYLELANREISHKDNPRGAIVDDKCIIYFDEVFYSDGTVIMVDADGKRYGKMKQDIGPRVFLPDYNLTFTTDKLCLR